MPANTILGAYRTIFVAIIIALSVQTATHAKNFTDHHFWLAAIEIVAALLLLFRRTQRVGLPLLVAVISVVAIHDLATGELPFTLILFAASATAIVMLDRAIH
jgi:hypothetical protein